MTPKEIAFEYLDHADPMVRKMSRAFMNLIMAAEYERDHGRCDFCRTQQNISDTLQVMLDQTMKDRP